MPRTLSSVTCAYVSLSYFDEPADDCVVGGIGSTTALIGTAASSSSLACQNASKSSGAVVAALISKGLAIAPPTARTGLPSTPVPVTSSSSVPGASIVPPTVVPPSGPESTTVSAPRLSLYESDVTPGAAAIVHVARWPRSTTPLAGLHVTVTAGAGDAARAA